MDEIQYIDQLNRYSQAVVYQGVAYIAGQVAADSSAGIEGQTRQVLERVDRVLESCATDKSRLLTASIYLKDLRDLDAFNLVWDSWVVPGRLPTRLPIEAKLAGTGYLVEVQVTAAVYGVLTNATPAR
ncbi:RidA family protein [Caballeronia sp. GACF5]|uniref:RidA family protein n=1 Tax=Caballeronia sp. GACF5 TaxID=2921746 RepID=UPI002028473F|nr:RidA family protein [Caballeronia sp. GACF5]